MNGMRNLKTSLLTLLFCCSLDPTTNSKLSKFRNYEIPKFRVFFWLRSTKKINGMRNLKTSLLTLSTTILLFTRSRNQFRILNFYDFSIKKNLNKHKGMRNLKTSLLPLTGSDNQFRISDSWIVKNARLIFKIFSQNHKER